MALISECAMTHGNAPTTWRISNSATSEVVAGAGIKLEYPVDQEVPEAPAVEAPAVECHQCQDQCHQCQDQCHQVGPMMVRSQSDQ